MSTPSALTVVYPPSFQNSFWTHPSYRPGAQSLYSKLQAGLDENQSILAFVAHRAQLEYSHAEALATPHPQACFPAPLFKQAVGILSEVLPIDGVGNASSWSASRGFTANTSATSRAFRMIQAETNTTHANAHGKVARHLEKFILEPFGKWAADHRERVTQSWQHVDATLARFERQKTQVDKLKHSYENKCRAADEAEDDARFAPIKEADMPSHSSHGTLPPPTARQTMQRTSVSGSSSVASTDSPSHQDETDPDKIKRRETIRKQFGFTHRATWATHTSPAVSSKDSNEFAGVKLPPLPTETEGEALSPNLNSNAPLNNATSLKRSGTISAFVSSAVEKMPAPLKAAVGGVVSAEPRHIRLRREADNAEKVYEEAVRNLDRTRCQVEQVLFEHYRLTQRWEADRIRAVQSVLASYNQALQQQIPILHQSFTRAFKIHEGLDASLELRALIRQARTGPFQPAIERFQPYYHDEISLGRKAGPQGVAWGWLIKNGGFGLDLSLVERLEYFERLERQQSGDNGAAEEERDGKVDKLATLPPVLFALLGALDRAYADEERWNAIAKALTPPNKDDEEGKEEPESSQPDASVVAQEKRKTWILEVPLPITHRLREALIAHLNPSSADLIYGNPSSSNRSTTTDTNPIPEKLLDSYDAPVLASCVKLWLLELEHSLITEELWDQIDSIYRAAAAQEHDALTSSNPPAPPAEQGTAEVKETNKVEVDESTKAKIRSGVLEDLRVVLSKLPRTHLACLDALFSHLCQLVVSTADAKEGESVYANKLGLALGRALLRPKRENRYTVTSQIGTLVVVDLLQNYQEILPGVVEKKKKDAKEKVGASTNGTGGERPMPIRKRTKPIDQRISRSSIGSDLQQGAKKLIEQMDERGLRGSGFNAGAIPAPVSGVPVESGIEGEKPQPTINTSTGLDAEKEKKEDNLAAPTPLSDRVLSHPASTARIRQEGSVEAETISISDEKAESQTPIPHPTSDSHSGDGEEEEKPLSNVARLSRQFNSTNLGSGHTKRTSLGGGGVRGPRPAGARAARMSGQFSTSSNTSGGATAEAVEEEGNEK